MMFLMDPEFWMRVVGIVVIDLTLAGDNALVIALAVRTLPKPQQLWGRIWGTAGAVGLRLAFIAVATYLLSVPLLQLVGGLATLMNRFAWIIWIGGGILGYVAGEMILKDKILARWLDTSAARLDLFDLLPLVPAIVLVALGWWFSTQNGRKKLPERV